MTAAHRHSGEASWTTRLRYLTRRKPYTFLTTNVTTAPRHSAWKARLRRTIKRRPHNETAKTRSLCWSHFNDGWYGETAAVVFSLACSIAIVVVLLIYKNKPTPKLPKGVTLNAIVSVLATASKAALLFTTSSCLGQLKWIWFRAEQPRSLSHVRIFDDASRGPLGALYLFTSGPRKSIASLGAILTLSALAYDPFVQQVISISPEVRYSLSNDVTTKQATRLDMYPGKLQSQQALNAGIYTNRFERSPVCSTGNCTFPNFSSVGWCGKCFQHSDWKFVDGCSLIFKDTDFYLKGPDDDWFFGANRTCRLISESGHSQDITIEAVGAIGDSFVDSTFDYSAVLPFFQTTTEIEPNPDVSINQPASRFPWGGRVPMGEWANAYFKIVNWSLVVDSVSACTLDLCLRDYDVTVTGGTTSTAASNERFGRRYYRSGMNFAEITQEEARQEFDEKNGAIAYLCWEPGGTPKNSSWKYETDNNLYVSPSDFAFCTSIADFFWDWYQIVAEAVVGNWSTSVNFGAGASLENGTLHFNSTNMALRWNEDEGSNTAESYNGSLTASDPEYYLDTGIPISAITIKQLGLEAVMSNIAASLTQLGLKDPSANDITGKIGTVETVVHVRWEWLALPGFLIIGVALFLIVTVILNNSSKTPIWKSSANALLYHGLEENLEEHSDLLTASSMANMADSTSVSLTMSVKSARLVLGTLATPAATEMMPVAPSESTSRAT